MDKEVKINDIIGNYKVKNIMFEPTDNFSVRFILFDSEKEKYEVFKYEDMYNLLIENNFFKSE